MGCQQSKEKAPKPGVNKNTSPTHSTKVQTSPPPPVARPVPTQYAAIPPTHPDGAWVTFERHNVSHSEQHRSGAINHLRVETVHEQLMAVPPTMRMRVEEGGESVSEIQLLLSLAAMEAGVGGDKHYTDKSSKHDDHPLHADGTTASPDSGHENLPLASPDGMPTVVVKGGEGSQSTSGLGERDEGVPSVSANFAVANDLETNPLDSTVVATADHLRRAHEDTARVIAANAAPVSAMLFALRGPKIVSIVGTVETKRTEEEAKQSEEGIIAADADNTFAVPCFPENVVNQQEKRQRNRAHSLDLYRIVYTDGSGRWGFYNDSQHYEFTVTVIFTIPVAEDPFLLSSGADESKSSRQETPPFEATNSSVVVPEGSTTVDYSAIDGPDSDDGPVSPVRPAQSGGDRQRKMRRVTLSTIVYPGATEAFMRQQLNFGQEAAEATPGRPVESYESYEATFIAKPLAPAYLEASRAEADSAVSRDMDAILRLTGGVGGLDDDAILHRCIGGSLPFVDFSFPPKQSSVGGPDTATMAWLRPQKIFNANDDAPEGVQASAFVGPLSVRDLPPAAAVLGGIQGTNNATNAWLVSALAAVVDANAGAIRIRRLFGAEGDGYEAEVAGAGANGDHVGAYRVWLCADGWWTSIVVDDYLPTIGGLPYFLRPQLTASSGEGSQSAVALWPALLEKALAKCAGSYEALYAESDTNRPQSTGVLKALRAIGTITGSPFALFNFDSARNGSSAAAADSDGLFERLVSCETNGYIVLLSTPTRGSTAAPRGATTTASSASSVASSDAYEAAGLLLDHHYSIMDIREYPELDLQLVRIRNPFNRGAAGNSSTAAAECPQWRGDWSANSPLWGVYTSVAEDCCHQQEDHQEGYRGEDDSSSFWMSFTDVQRYFVGGGIVYTTPIEHNPVGSPISIATAESQDLLSINSNATVRRGRPRHTYAIKGSFDGVTAIPSTVLAVTVSSDKPVELWLSLTQSGSGKTAPLMISVCDENGAGPNANAVAHPDNETESAKLKREYAVILNSNMSVTRPGPSFTFGVAKEVAMKCVLAPSREPYLIIPRCFKYPRDDVEGGQVTSAAPASASPFLLSLHSPIKPAASSSLSVAFHKLDAKCQVFDNHTKFLVESESETAFYQYIDLSAPGLASAEASGVGIAM